MKPDTGSMKRLKEIVEECFARAADQNLDMQSWADAAGVVYTTIWKLVNGDTRFPRFQTVVMIAKAVGLEVTLTMHKKGKRAA